MPNSTSRRPVLGLLTVAFGLAFPVSLAGCGEEKKTGSSVKVDPEAVKAQENAMDFMKNQSKKPAPKK